MRQLSRFSEARVVRLSGFVATIGAFAAVGFQEIATALGQDDCAVVGADQTSANEPFILQMPKASSRVAGIIAQVVKIALGHDAKGTNRPEHPALSAVDLADALALSYRASLTSAWQLEILREHVTWVLFFVRIPIAASAAIAAISVP
jgi:hypothetical protein